MDNWERQGSTWWSVATMIVLGLLAGVLVVSGIRTLVRKP
ncbi:hypothetical protein FBY39_0918 [Microbacterium sp. SLBN-146]|nr:hypothetical protein FBY39_0918 [Microbacterium sp. SLBN-146]